MDKQGRKSAGWAGGPQRGEGIRPQKGQLQEELIQETLKEDVFPATLCRAGRPVLGIMGKEELRGGLEQHLNYCTKSSVLAKGPRELLWAPE